MSKGGFLNSQLSTLICFIDDLTIFEQPEFSTTCYLIPFRRSSMMAAAERTER